MIGHNQPPPSFSAKLKLERIKHIVERNDLTSSQKCAGIGLVCAADREWAANVKTAELMQMASAKDKETVFRATKALRSKGLIEKASARGQSGRYNIIPPQIVEAVMEAYDELKSSQAEAAHFAESGPLKPDGTSADKSTRSAVKPGGFDPTTAPASRMPARAQMESLRDSYIPVSEDKSPLSPQGEEVRVTFEKGRLKLFNGLKAFWLDKFGDEELLDLALIQAAPYVQENSRRPLETQVSAQLARKVADKLDKDARYAKAVKSNAKGEAQSESRIDRWQRKLEEITAEGGKPGGHQ